MQDQLKKAFMRGVCALNFEAMNILTPENKEDQMRSLEKEMMRQFEPTDRFDQQDETIS